MLKKTTFSQQQQIHEKLQSFHCRTAKCKHPSRSHLSCVIWCLSHMAGEARDVSACNNLGQLGCLAIMPSHLSQRRSLPVWIWVYSNGTAHNLCLLRKELNSKGISCSLAISGNDWLPPKKNNLNYFCLNIFKQQINSLLVKVWRNDCCLIISGECELIQTFWKKIWLCVSTFKRK